MSELHTLKNDNSSSSIKLVLFFSMSWPKRKGSGFQTTVWGNGVHKDGEGYGYGAEE
jgi:hypothetical protein